MLKEIINKLIKLNLYIKEDMAGSVAVLHTSTIRGSSLVLRHLRNIEQTFRNKTTIS